METITDNGNFELSPHQKLVFEACAKIQKGKALWEEGKTLLDQGKIELANLMGEGSSKKKKPGPRKTIPGRTARIPSTFKKETRKDSELAEKIREVFLKEGALGEVTATTIRNRLHLGIRHTRRIVATMGDLKFVNKGNKCILVKSRETDVPHGGTINVEQYEGKAIALLQSDNWISLEKFKEGVGLSVGPAKRLIDLLFEKKLVKWVSKSNNPAHKKDPRIFPRKCDYLELV